MYSVASMDLYLVITKTCPCNMQHFLKVEKMIILDKKMIFFLFFLKTMIVCTR